MGIAFEERTSRRNDTEPSVFCIDIERNSPIPGIIPHYHNYIEILYAIDCNLSVWINDEEIHFSSGELILINSHEAHEVYAKEENVGKYFVIKFSPGILRFNGQPAEETRYLLPLLRNDLSNLRKISEKELKDYSIDNLMKAIANEWNLYSSGSPFALRGLVLSLFSRIVRIWETRNTDSIFANSDETTKIIYSVAEYCSENFVNITEKDVSEKFGLSYSYFARTFKKVMKKSFTSYITDLRIDLSRKLLLTTSLSITEIAQETGFSTTSHFIASFRKKTGSSPLAYKKKLFREI